MLLPTVASIGFMLMAIHGDPTGGGILAGFVFLALSFVIGGGALRMARGWDESETEH
ncbi:MAG: hypothetical protein JNL83_22370 [Myxococcales bacterium]|nr:hypothetical protein [Myxococcales bacterium]